MRTITVLIIASMFALGAGCEEREREPETFGGELEEAEQETEGALQRGGEAIERGAEDVGEEFQEGEHETDTIPGGEREVGGE